MLIFGCTSDGYINYRHIKSTITYENHVETVYIYSNKHFKVITPPRWSITMDTMHIQSKKYDGGYGNEYSIRMAEGKPSAVLQGKLLKQF